MCKWTGGKCRANKLVVIESDVVGVPRTVWAPMQDKIKIDTSNNQLTHVALRWVQDRCRQPLSYPS